MFRNVMPDNRAGSMKLSTGTQMQVLSVLDKDHTQAWYVIMVGGHDTLEFGISDEAFDAIAELIGDMRNA